MIPPPAPVPLWQVPLADLMDCPSHCEAWERSIAAAIADENYVDERIRFNPVFYLKKLAASEGLWAEARPFGIEGMDFAVDAAGANPVMAVFGGDDAGIVGGAYLNYLFVLPEHRGRGIGPEMIIQAFEAGLWHPETMNRGNSLTRAGRANRVKAHAIAVERALNEGHDVPDGVLTDYPMLAPPSGPRL